MQEAMHDTSLYREHAKLDPGAMRLPDETIIVRFRHLLEENNLSIQLLATINATLATRGLMLRMWPEITSLPQPLAGTAR